MALPGPKPARYWRDDDFDRLRQGLLNVCVDVQRDYGAKGDGVTDDTAAFQNAINYALANGAEVHVPPVARGSFYSITRLYFQYDATYNPGAPSTSLQSRPLRFHGVGAHTDLSTYDAADRARSILVSSDATGPALIIDGAGTAYASRQIEIEGLTVIATNTTSVISLTGANTGSTLCRCLIEQKGAGHGVDMTNVWMMGLEGVLIQCGASTMTTGSVGLRMRWNGVGGGPIWAKKVFVQRSYQQKTTGSITTGTNTLTLAAACDFTNGQAISVQGAGAGGNWLDTTISGGGGTTTLTLADNASTTVTAQPVRHGGGFDYGIQIGGLTGETGYDYYASAIDFRCIVAQWCRTGIVLGGRPSAVTISHLWTEGNRQRGIFLTNRVCNARIAHAYMNDLRASDGEIVFDSATGATAMVATTIENVWMANIHSYGITFSTPQYTSGRIVGCRFTKHTSGTPGAGIGINTGGVAAPWASEHNIFDTWSGLVAYDDSSKIAWIVEKDGALSNATLPVYADNAAAAAGGLAVGAFYRTATGQLMVRY